MTKSVLVGLSGGVDSAVAAIILKQKGFNVIGYTLKFGEKNNKCCKVDDASLTASQLGIDYFTIDIYEEFEEKIIQYFIDEYLMGRTPSPCPRCNIFKFGLAIEYANKHNIDFVATGHYGVIRKRNLYSSNSPKDQSYFLSILPKSYFEKIQLPLGQMTKTETRKLASDNNLRSASIKDSQDICFVSGDYRDFLKERGVSASTGHFVDTNNNIIGTHNGFFNFTIGQRYRAGGLLERKYIIGVNTDTNDVIVGADKDLITKEILISKFNLLGTPSDFSGDLFIKIRSKDKLNAGKIKSHKNNFSDLVFATTDNIRAVTPGQLAVIYIFDNTEDLYKVVGGGWITG